MGSGCRMRVGHRSQAAPGVAWASAPEVCILDIGLPDMDGNALARRLRDLPQTRGALLIAVTGDGRAEDRAAAQAAGFDHHMVRPLDVHKLIELLDQPH